MSENFDPYRKWLGIPPEEQPPNHYRLLGVGLFESDPDVISNAADRQMTHVRTFQSGRYSALSQQILNELSAARICLLDAKRKSEYDEQLRKTLAAQAAAAAPVPPPPAPPPAPPLPPPAAADAALPAASAATALAAGPAPVVARPKRTPATAYVPGRRRDNWQGPAITVVLIAALVVLAAWMVANFSTVPAPPPKPTIPVVRQAPSEGLSESAANPRRPPERPGTPRPGPRAPRGFLPPGAAAPQPAATPPVRPAPSSVAPGSNTPDAVGEIRTFIAQTGAVRSAVFSPDGAFVLSGGDDKTVRLFDVESEGVLRSFEGPTYPVLGVAFSADGLSVAAVCAQTAPPEGAKLYLWHSAGGPATLSVDLASLPYANAVCFSPDGQKIALAAQDHTIRVLDVKGQETLRLEGHRGPVTCVAFSPDGQSLASGSEDQTVRVWKTSSPDPGRELTGHTGPVYAVAWLPDGQHVLSAGQDKAVILWSVGTGQPKFRLQGHTGAVYAVACSPDGAYAVSGGADAAVRFWDLAGGREILHFDGHQGAVRSVALSFTGGRRRIVSAGDDGTVRLWGAPGGVPAAQPAAPAGGQDQGTTPGAAGPARSAVPADWELVRATKEIRQRYQDEFAAAKDPARKRALAEKLLNNGFHETDNALALAELQLARDLAAEAGDVDTAFASVDEISHRFDVNAAEVKARTLEALAQSSGPDLDRRALVERILAAADEALAQDDAVAAERLIVLARPVVAKVDDAAVSRRVAARGKEILQIKKAYEEQGIPQAQATLKAQPDDPRANEVLGKFLCLTKGQWEAGLSKLAKAADARLRQLAQDDLADPKDPEQQFALAEGWWAWGEGQTGAAQEHVRRHAARWYKAAAPLLTGAHQDVAQNRLLELGESDGQLTPELLPAIDGLESRKGATKATLLKALGGNAASEEAVHKSLRWLANHQYANGGWSFDHNVPQCQGQCDNAGTLAGATNAATALALLPFLGADNGPRHGTFRVNVFRGLQYLAARMTLVPPDAATLYEPGARQVPSHAWGTIALCEAAALSGENAGGLRISAQAAVNFIVLTQNADGGWGYQPKPPEKTADASDPTALAWNLAALVTARWAGCQVPDKTLRAAEKYLDSLQSKDGSGYGADPARPDRLATVESFLCRIYLGWPRDTKALGQYAADLGQNTPEAGDFQFNYHATLLLRNFGGQPWQRWNPALRDLLVAQQSRKGHSEGSWYFPGSEPMNRLGGRLYATAMAALILESYYRHPPAYP